MSTLATLDQPTQLAVIGDEWPQSRLDFIKKNFCGDAPEHLAEVFLQLCKRRNLSPEARHIYLVPRYANGQKTWVPQTSIDGYRLIADRTGKYAGTDEPQYTYNEAGTLASASVTVYKIVGGTRCPFTAVAHWSEFYPGDKQGHMWNKMPHVMLAKVAEGQALRKAFPEDLSGVYTDEEMAQAGEIREVNTSTGEIIDTTYNEPDQNYDEAPPVTERDQPKMSDKHIEEWVARILECDGMTPEAQKKQLNTLLKQAVQERNVQKIELMVEYLEDDKQADQVAQYAANKGLNSQRVVDLLTERAEGASDAE